MNTIGLITMIFTFLGWVSGTLSLFVVAHNWFPYEVREWKRYVKKWIKIVLPNKDRPMDAEYLEDIVNELLDKSSVDRAYAYSYIYKLVCKRCKFSLK